MGVGAVLREEEHVAGAEAGDAHVHLELGGAERAARERHLLRQRLAGSAHAVDHRDELGMHERLVEDEAGGDGTGRRLHHVVGGVQHDARRLERLEHLVDAVGDDRVRDLDGTVAAVRRVVQQPHESRADRQTDEEADEHQRTGVHAPTLGDGVGASRPRGPAIRATRPRIQLAGTVR
jgi:hypothetical protein